MSKKTSPAATQDDLKQFMEHVTGLIGDMDKRMTDRMEAWKDEIVQDTKRWKGEIIRHFDTVAENLKADFRGALAGKIDQHEDRIVVLEEHAGIRP
jgi:hypothetical protein